MMTRTLSPPSVLSATLGISLPGRSLGLWSLAPAPWVFPRFQGQIQRTRKVAYRERALK